MTVNLTLPQPHLRELSKIGWDLRLHALKAGGPGSIPGWGTRSHIPRLRLSTAK